MDFTYTVGLWHSFRRPELVMFGLGGEDMQHWLNAADGFVHRGLGPDDILLTTGGGDAGGHSAFFPSWSRGRSVPFVTKEVPA